MRSYVDYDLSYKDVNERVRALPATSKGDVLELLTAFGQILDANPERIHQEHDGFVYQHPEPAIEVHFTADDEKEKIRIRQVTVRNFAPKVLVFISYSHQDRKWLEELQPYIKTVRKFSRVEIWDDRALEPGDDFKQVIVGHIANSDAAFLLVSQHFLASEFISEVELPLIEQRHGSDQQRIYWLPVRHTFFPEGSLFTRVEAAVKLQKPINDLRTPARERIYKALFHRLVDSARRAAATHG